MSSGLTPVAVARLKDYFPFEAHEFKKGMVYLTEQSITNRLDEVDPNWSFSVREMIRRDDSFIAYGSLTVCGVSRDNAGMEAISLDRETKTKVTNEPEKAAVTDLLKRCARMFGIGRYMLSMKDIKDESQLLRWLASQNPASPPTPLVNVTAEWLDQPFSSESWAEWLAWAFNSFPGITEAWVKEIIGSGRAWNAKGQTYRSAMDNLTAATEQAHPEWMP